MSPASPMPASSSLLKNSEFESFLVTLRSLSGGAMEVGCDFRPVAELPPDVWRLCGEQFGDADQIVGDQVEQKVGGDATDAAMLGFAHGSVLLAPAEDALDHRPA
jgi:hypothetical protein